MNITKRILITAALFISCSTQTSELTPVLLEKTNLSLDPIKIIESYVWDGTIILDVDFEFRTKYFYNPKKPVFQSQFVRYTNVNVQAITHLISRSLVKDKRAGAIIPRQDIYDQHLYFKLIEDKNENMAAIEKWKPQLLQELMKQGFTGCHAQMERFLAYIPYLTRYVDDDKKIVTDWNTVIAEIIQGDAKKAESTT